jgi:hypothetical protein
LRARRARRARRAPAARPPANTARNPGLPPFGFAFGPDTDPLLGSDPIPFILLMLAGFLIGTVGHIYKARAVVVLGIAMIFLATVLLPLAIYSQR